MRSDKPCECGCGRLTKVATRTDKKRGTVCGEPRRYIKGHSANSGAALERFSRKYVVDLKTGCWVWIKGHRDNGYGEFHFSKEEPNVAAHVASYRLHIGPIPSGFEIHHECRNRGCVNPDHLRAVTRKQHLQLEPRHIGRQTHCRRGHAMTPENTYIHGKAHAHVCKTCNLAWQQARKEKHDA